MMIEPLKELLFTQEFKTRKDIHFPLIDQIEKLLRKQGFLMIKEKPINFMTKRVKDSQELIRSGFMDLYGKKEGVRIAIELDSGEHLKFKSIEKLLQSNANICIGIIYGNKNKKQLVNENVKRILSRMHFLNNTEKEFWIFMISERIVKIVV